MTKRFSLFLLLVVFMTSFAFSQTRNVHNEKMQIPSDQNQIVVQTQTQESLALTPGTQLFNTGYDYMCNNTIGPMIALADIDGMGGLDPIMCGMQRFDPAGDRTTRFAYIAFGVTDNFSAFDVTDVTSGSPTYGWGNLQLLQGGPWDGDVMIMAHSGGAGYHTRIDLVNLEARTPFPTTSVGGNFPSFTYQSDGTILTTDTDMLMYLSTDQGVTFDPVSFIGDGDPQVDILGSTNPPAEVPIWRSTDGMYLSIAGVWENATVDTNANPHPFYVYHSSDGGGTWNGTIAGSGDGGLPEYGQVTNRNPFAPYFQNFSQIQGNVSNDGVTHLVANGYGEGAVPGPDTTNMFTILYWNSNHENWIAVSMPEMEQDGDGFGNFVNDPVRIYPGNGIGQAYPNLSVSDDGQIVFVMWQAYEYTGDVGTSEWNIFPGDGGTETGEIYYTDLYYAFSEDGGVTWSDVGVAKGDADVMEQYPMCAQNMIIEGNQATVHYMYMEDAVPGTAVFNAQLAGQNDWSTDTYWLHDVMTFTLISVGVEDEIVVNSFNLAQNYPNPFNPTTNIKYSLAERSAVSLIVYDILGNEIATLVNTTQSVGDYDINFDAANLASGLYIYTLKAGSFTSTKKMMLLK